jgi:hypothetical protein
MKAAVYQQPWLGGRRFDLLWIVGPALLALFICPFLPESFKNSNAESPGLWLLLVVFVDVAHVYSTLFRTYLDRERFSRHRTLYLGIPVICYVTGVLLYRWDALWFWRILAYLAVFHFVRQQYGFLRLYTRRDQIHRSKQLIDSMVIYAATIYPLVYWHCSAKRNFHWFVAGDFLLGWPLVLQKIAGALYCLLLLAYLISECAFYYRNSRLNIPKNMLLLGTALSWYFGIVVFNGDMAFTLLNVVAHGIPYMALVWLGRRTDETKPPAKIAMRIIGFLGLIFILAYLEEGLWDGLVWREHSAVFQAFLFLPAISKADILIWLVPLLSLPQSTHYVLDGFIWKRRHV